MSVSGLSDTLAPGLGHKTALKRPLCFVQRGLVPILARVIGRRFRVRVTLVGDRLGLQSVHLNRP